MVVETEHELIPQLSESYHCLPRGLSGLSSSKKARSLFGLSVSGTKGQAQDQEITGEIEVIWLELEVRLPGKLGGKAGIEQE